MKNFRKVLALVLVVATLFSFTAMAGAKSLSDYEDADKVSYDVAVDVLSALEILNGYEDDTFKPTNTITRAEMAKMIAVLANAGDANVDKLYAAACNFADVDKVNDWFASYVSYCAYTGIVAGRSADTFDPYGKVTGLETAKMLLVTMGFSAEEQGYVGANWKINVLRDAQNVGLLNGFAAGYDIDAAITREEAANMMLNALCGNVIVGVLSENILKVTNAVYKNLDNYVWATLIDASNPKLVNLYGNVIVSDVTLAEALYGGKLTVKTTADCYGRPGEYYTFVDAKGNEISDKIFFGPAPVVSETKAIDVDAALKNEVKNGYALEIYEDGERISNYEKMPATLTFPTLESKLGNGVLIEIYVEDTGKANDKGEYVPDGKVTIVVINTFIGEVQYTTKQENTFTVESARGTEKFSNKDYGFAKGDMVLFWVCNGGKEAAPNKYVPALHDAELAVPVTADVTRVTKANDTTKVESTLTADGKVYTYHKGVTAMTAEQNKYEGTYDLYLDKYGYIMLFDKTPVVDEVFYGYAVEKTGLKTQDTVAANGKHYWASITKDIVDFDAKLTEDVQISNWLFDKIAGNGVLFRYTVDEDGIARAYEPGEAYNPGQAFATKETRNFILTKDGDLTLEDGTMYGHGTDETKYLVRTWDYDNAEYVYTSFVGELDQAYAGWVNGEKGAKVATVQYFLDEKTFLEYVFVDAIYTTNATYAFILGDYESVSDDKWSAQIDAYDSYRAVVDGQEAIVLLNRTENLDENVLIKTKFSCIGLTDAGLPVYAEAAAQRETFAGKAAEYYEGKLLVGNNPIEKVYSIAEDANVVVIYKDMLDADEDGIAELEFVALDEFKNINDYLEDGESLDGNGGDTYNWTTEKLWVIETSAGSGVAQTLYVIVK